MSTKEPVAESATPALPRVATIADLVALHAEDAAFLWHRRQLEIDGPLLGDDDIGRIDQRLDANLEGLLAAGLTGWETAMQQFSLFADAGEVFVLGSLALLWNDPGALEAALQAVREAGEEGVYGFSGAIARSTPQNLGKTVGKWLNSPDKALRYFGLCALSHHRVDPKQDLAEFLADSDPRIRIRAQRLAGELGRIDVLPMLERGLEGKTGKERFTAALAICCLGKTELAQPVLEQLLAGDEELSRQAMEIRLLTESRASAGRWLREQLEKPQLRVAATACLGLLGDRGVMPQLIEAMRDPLLIAAAGSALRDLFEIDFDDTDLFSLDEEQFSEEFAELVDDEELPVADLVIAWWNETHGEGEATFKSMRRQRFDALRACFANPGKPLQNWRHTRRFPCWV